MPDSDNRLMEQLAIQDSILGYIEHMRNKEISEIQLHPNELYICDKIS